MRYPILVNNENIQNPSELIGKPLGFYEDFFHQMVDELPDYVAILESVGEMVQSLDMNIQWSNDVALIINENHNAANYILDRYITEFIGCDSKSNVSDTVYQSVIGSCYNKVKDLCKFAYIQVEGIFFNYRKPMYNNLFHYLHSGVISLSSGTAKVSIAENPEGIIREYCTIYLETKDEADYLFKYLQIQYHLKSIADARDQVQKLQDEMNSLNKKVHNRVRNSDSYDFYLELDFLQYLRFDGSWLKGLIDFDALGNGGYTQFVLNKLAHEFIPARKKRTPKCCDTHEEFEDPYVFSLTGYKNPYPTDADKNRWPELYGKTEEAIFLENLEKELESFPAQYRERVKEERLLDFRNRTLLTHRRMLEQKYLRS